MKPQRQNFIWGCAAAAYQIEGAAKTGGRADSIWDVFCNQPGTIAGGDTGDIACDHYHRYPDDIKLMKDLGVDAYRFSVSWPRLMPGGTGAVNPEGRDFYNRLIDTLLEGGITPWVTAYHWDLPQTLQEKGGWTNRDCIFWFQDYARTLAGIVGDRVNDFILLNEPSVHAYHGHFDGTHAPGLVGAENLFKAIHHQNMAISTTYRLLKAENAGWHVGSSYTLFPVLPASASAEDAQAAQFMDALWNGAFFDPLFTGRYPDLLTAMFDEISEPDDLAALHQPLDFTGVQHYAPFYVRSAANDIGAEIAACPDNFEMTAMGWPIAPEAFYECLMRFKQLYNNPVVYITENGAAYNDRLEPDGAVHDDDRVAHYKAYVSQMMRAIEDGADIRGYFAWSLLDNFEWACGYEKRFGLVYVDYKTCNRHPKDSFYWYQNFLRLQRNSPY